jgi:hypothetical protein
MRQPPGGREIYCLGWIPYWDENEQRRETGFWSSWNLVPIAAAGLALASQSTNTITSPVRCSGFEFAMAGHHATELSCF